jgi:DNA-binding transcriptional LysR family regulator
MELEQMRCFAAVAEELHFGRAARRLEMLPAALGRRIRQLEEDLGVCLLLRTTRSVALTPDGVALLEGAQDILGRTDALARGIRERARRPGFTLKLGAIDTAAAGFVPDLLHDFRKRRPDVTVQLAEEKTIRLLPRLLSGRLDLALIRPPGQMDRRIEHAMLFHETPVVAVPARLPSVVPAVRRLGVILRYRAECRRRQPHRPQGRRN